MSSLRFTLTRPMNLSSITMQFTQLHKLTNGTMSTLMIKNLDIILLIFHREVGVSFCSRPGLCALRTDWFIMDLINQVDQGKLQGVDERKSHVKGSTKVYVEMDYHANTTIGVLCPTVENLGMELISVVSDLVLRQWIRRMAMRET